MHEISNATFYKLLENRQPVKRLVECTMQYFHLQHAQTIVLPCRQRQKLPHVWSAVCYYCVFSLSYMENYICLQEDEGVRMVRLLSCFTCRGRGPAQASWISSGEQLCEWNGQIWYVHLESNLHAQVYWCNSCSTCNKKYLLDECRTCVLCVVTWMQDRTWHAFAIITCMFYLIRRWKILFEDGTHIYVYLITHVYLIKRWKIFLGNGTCMYIYLITCMSFWLHVCLFNYEIEVL